MHFVNHWASLICLSCILCVIINLISPPGKMEKSLRMVLGLFMVVTIVSPLSNKNFKKIFSINLETNISRDIESALKKIDNQFESLAKDRLEAIISEYLKDLGIKSEKIEIFMDTNKNECISINKCKIYISRNCEKNGLGENITSYKILEIVKQIQKALNIETEVLLVE